MIDPVLDLAAALQASHQFPHVVPIRVGELILDFRTNSSRLRQQITEAMGPFLREDGSRAEQLVHGIETEALALGFPFEHWEREGGKIGGKDTFFDSAEGRVLRKVRTGMVFFRGAGHSLAVGPCEKNPNQVVNFINALAMEHELAKGGVLCHASGVARGDRGILISARSGGGKSTLALKLLEHGLDFVTNDRATVRRKDGRAVAVGVPKFPRVNPGTLLNHERLVNILSKERQESLRKLPLKDLWSLEEKYDVPVLALFPGCQFRLFVNLAAFIILSWRPMDFGKPVVQEVDLRSRPDLIPVLAKHPGPFIAGRDGNSQSKPEPMDPEAYAEALAGVPMIEVTGGVDFAWFGKHVLERYLPVETTAPFQ